MTLKNGPLNSLNWNHSDGRLFGVLRTETGELCVQKDNGKDLRQWRIEPQSIDEQLIIDIIDNCYRENGHWTMKIFQEFARRGITLTEVPYW